MEALTVTRSVTIDADLDRVWRELATADGLAAWLDGVLVLDADGERSAARDLMPGAAGWFTDDRPRRIVVGEMRPGTRLAFTWWPDDDADAASSVVVELTTDRDRTTVIVTETLDPIGALGGRASLCSQSTVDDLGAVWTGRLGALAERLSPLPVWA